MNIVVGSAFRNASRYLNRYLAQIMALREHVDEPRHHVRVIAVEGDSHDGTAETLLARADLWDIDIDVINCDHGHPEFGSTESPVRMRELSKVCAAIHGGLRPHDDVLLYVESDLVWQPHDVGSLIDMADRARTGSTSSRRWCSPASRSTTSGATAASTVNGSVRSRRTTPTWPPAR